MVATLSFTPANEGDLDGCILAAKTPSELGGASLRNSAAISLPDAKIPLPPRLAIGS
jgi:hypothetical protein